MQLKIFDALKNNISDRGNQYNKNCYCVLNAYGIKGRGPAASEIAYIRKWSEEYGFALEVILEACDRTMNSIHQPSFDYTDSILKRWKDKNVRQLKDIDAVDADYRKEKERAKELAKELVSSGLLGLDGRTCMNIEFIE